MKATYTVIFLVLCTSWIYSAAASAIPVEIGIANDEYQTTEAGLTDSMDMESNVTANKTEEDVEQALAQESEISNAIEPEVRPTKRPKRPNSNKRPAAGDHKPHHHNPMALPASWPYYPIPYPMSYPPCPYPQPMFYPMPMYSPYFFPSQMHTSEKKIPANAMQSDVADSAESGEEISNEELLRNANLWKNRFENKWANKTSNSSTTVKPTKRFIIRNWVANKLNKKTTTTTTTTTPAQ